MSENIYTLTEQQFRFAQNIAAGFPKAKSYTSAGYQATGASAPSCASRLLRMPEIQRAVRKLRDEQRAVFLLSWETKVKTVERVIMDPATKPHTRLAAIRLHNQMMADYEPMGLIYPPDEPADDEYGYQPKPERQPGPEPQPDTPGTDAPDTETSNAEQNSTSPEPPQDIHPSKVAPPSNPRTQPQTPPKEHVVPPSGGRQNPGPIHPRRKAPKSKDREPVAGK